MGRNLRTSILSPPLRAIPNLKSIVMGRTRQAVWFSRTVPCMALQQMVDLLEMVRSSVCHFCHDLQLSFRVGILFCPGQPILQDSIFQDSFCNPRRLLPAPSPTFKALRILTLIGSITRNFTAKRNRYPRRENCVLSPNDVVAFRVRCPDACSPTPIFPFTTGR